MYRVEFRRSAVKDLRRLDSANQGRVLRAIDGLAQRPRPVGCRKLTNGHDAYRIRVGDYRVIYVVSDAVLVVAIERIRHRRQVDR